MEWKTHFIAGAAAGVLAAGDLSGLMLGGLFGILPDVDEPNSRVGRTLWFISLPVSLKFRHRTFTHSLPFVGLLSGLMYILDPKIALIACAGLLSHILGDMLTGKVNLFYPTKKWVGIAIPDKLFPVIDRITRWIMSLVLIGLVLKSLGLFNNL